jgi:hypothetical protein
MTEKKLVYESDAINLTSFQLVIGNVPSPEPESKRRLGKYQEKQAHEMEVPIKRLIAHLKSEKK